MRVYIKGHRGELIYFFTNFMIYELQFVSFKFCFSTSTVYDDIERIEFLFHKCWYFSGLSIRFFAESETLDRIEAQLCPCLIKNEESTWK